MIEAPYNPLAKRNLANSIEREILRSAPIPLDDIGSVTGAGVYALYYVGDFAPYALLKVANGMGKFGMPVYVGKAIPAGGRKGGLGKDASKGTSLRKRLAQHAASIDEASNLRVEDFYVRYLVVDDVWIPLGENALIETFKPFWNQALDGFGNNPAGEGRKGQLKSPWDILHPGRKRADTHVDLIGDQFFVERAADYFAGRPLKPLPKNLRDQLKELKQASEDAADEA